MKITIMMGTTLRRLVGAAGGVDMADRTKIVFLIKV
jgi:hypothetical protein